MLIRLPYRSPSLQCDVFADDMTLVHWRWCVEQEISILKSISYDRNIVQFYGAVLSGSEPMLVLEYMEVSALAAARVVPSFVQVDTSSSSGRAIRSARITDVQTTPDAVPASVQTALRGSLGAARVHPFRVRLVDSDSYTRCSQGGDLRAALSSDLTGELRWYNRGQHIALDVARGLHYLHSHDVRAACNKHHLNSSSAACLHGSTGECSRRRC